MMYRLLLKANAQAQKQLHQLPLIIAQDENTSIIFLEQTRRNSESTEKHNGNDVMMKTIEQTSRLSEHQREIIKETFKALEEDPIKHGLKILLRLFSEYPRYKLVWPQFRAIPDSSLMNAIELRRHASVYMCGLHSIINSMNDEHQLATQLNRIAKAHIKWNIHRSHIVHMLEPVLEVVKESNGYKMDEETKQAWTTLYDVIANLIEIYRNKPSH